MTEILHGEHPIVGHELNKTFDKVLMMGDAQFGEWNEDVRVHLGKWWEQDGIPPMNGMPLDQMERELQRLSISRSCGLVLDESTYERNVLAAGQKPAQMTLRRIFTNMDMVGDGNADGLSLRDFVTTADATTDAGRKLLRRWSNHFQRNVKRDSLYQYSPQLRMRNPLAFGAETGREWVKLFAASPKKNIGFWVEATKKQPTNGELFLTASEVARLEATGPINRTQIVNVLGGDASRYRLRIYELWKRIFPTYFGIMRKSLVRSGSCFSPPIAKFLIQRYT